MARGDASRADAGAAGNVQTHPSVAADAAVARTAARLGVEYVLRTIAIMSEYGDGDFITALVYFAVASGNTVHLDQDPQTAGRYSGLDSVPSDDKRRPVSVLALAGSLGLPYETARRHAAKLVKAGTLVRVRGGLLVPEAVIRGESGGESAEENPNAMINVGNLRRLYRGLRRAGFAFD